MATEEDAPAVTAWRLKRIEEGLGAVLDKLEDRPDWKDVRNIEATLKERIQRTEDWQTWALRLGGPAFLGGGVAIVVNALRISG